MDIEFARDFWDCECEQSFIHPTDVDRCLICGSEKEDQPNSIVHEVAAHYGISARGIRRDGK